MIATQMEATFYRAYNTSKSRRLELRITVADCAGEPFKLMKVILDGLAQNPEAAFWLTNLQHTPQIVRIFPLDFAYLDSDLNILQAVELPPGVPLPRFHPQAASALILPLGSLASNQTAKGDQLVIASEEEIDRKFSGSALLPDTSASEPAPVEPRSIEPTPVETASVAPPPPVAQPLEPAPFFTPQSTVPVQPPAMGSGSGFTVAIASTWQVATGTTAPLISDSAETPAEAVAPSEPLPSEQSKVETQPPAPINTSEKPETHAPARVTSDIDLAQIAILQRALSKIESPESSSSTSPILTPDDTVQRRKKVLTATEELIARSKQAAEKDYVKVVPSPAPATKAKKKTAQKSAKKEHIGNKVVRWLALEEPLPERRKIIRLVLQGLQAYEADGDSGRRYIVRDICPPGIFIQTDRPWQQDDVLSLVLIKQGATDRDAEHRVSIQARVIRRDEEGVAVAFVFPEGTEFQPWQRAKTKRSDETEAEFILRELRLARALGFLRRLCPWAADEINHALLDRFSNKRVGAAVEITLKAEDTLRQRGHIAQPFVSSDILIRILESGSWIEEDWIRRMWAGLMVSSFSADGQDRTNLQFIDLLARLTPIHLRIFSYVCHRALDAVAAGESEAALDLYSTAEELMEAADSHSFSRIQQTIGQLSSVGLFADTARPSYVAMSDKSKTRTTPTSLGLRMFARCNGHQS